MKKCHLSAEAHEALITQISPVDQRMKTPCLGNQTKKARQTILFEDVEANPEEMVHANRLVEADPGPEVAVVKVSASQICGDSLACIGNGCDPGMIMEGSLPEIRSSQGSRENTEARMFVREPWESHS